MKKSNFDLSHERLQVARPDGTLYPILCEDVIPGDIWKGNSQIFARMLPLVSPIYSRFDIYVHYYFVPYELVWKNWRKFFAPDTVDEDLLPENSGVTFPAFGVHGTGVSVPNPANVPEHAVASGSLADYMGIRWSPEAPNSLNDTETPQMFSALPFRAYQMIYNEYYRDPDLENANPVATTDGYVNANEASMFVFRQRNLEKDYFTSARPYAQRGEPVSINSPISHVLNPEPMVSVAYKTSDGSNASTQTVSLQTTAGNTILNGSVDGPISLWTEGTNLNETNITIEQFRWANAMQKFLEKVYRTGSRYVNFLKGFYGVNPRDMRLDRPEYIGGGRQPFNISEVLQTSESSDNSPLGTFGGRAITYGNHNFRYKVEEHGVIIGLLSIMPRVSYLHGIRRQLMHLDRFDFPLPEFASIGNQAIKGIELTGWAIDESETFGYTDRYAEYKFIPSTTHGSFRHDPYLKSFHTSRMAEYAFISNAFVKPDWANDIARIFADESTSDVILLTIQNRITAIRPLPRLSMPNLF